MSRTSPSPDFDPRIADWLEDDPDDAPDVVLATVLAAFPSIPQQHASRVPWRFRPMTQTTRLLAGAAAVAVLLIGGVFLLRPGAANGPGASPSALPTASPSSSPGSAGGSPATSGPAALAATFRSTRYGYTVKYPTSWTATPATKSWAVLQQNLWGSGYNDELKGTDIRFSGTSIALAEGQTADEWLAAYAAGGDVGSWPTVTIDGVVGRIDYDGGPAGGGTIAPGGRMFDAVVISGPIAYNFNMDGNVDRATFERFLATVKLPVIPALDRTFTSPLAGYSIDHPSAWNPTPASKAWTSGYDTKSFSDHIGTAPAIDGTSTKLPTATTFDTWFAAYDADRVKGTCGRPSLNEDITIDGAPGHLDVHCAESYLEAVVEKGGRVYVFTMFTPFSRPLFETLIGSVHLTPASAKN